MSQYEPKADYPKTVKEAYEQGKRDRRAGYPRTWTPHLGPKTSDEAFWAWWRAGWDGDPTPEERGES